MENKINTEEYASLSDLIKEGRVIDGPFYEPGYVESKDNDDDDISMWVNVNGIYTGAIKLKVENKLPSGAYKITWNDRQGEYEFSRHIINTDELIKFDNENITPIINEINDFWKKKDLYEKYKITHKRGLLLSGGPGVGKSALISLLIKDILDNDGLVFIATNTREFNYLIDAIPTIVRKIEPTRPIITVIEDIDKILSDCGGNDAGILDFLDGKTSIEHHICILTSNNTSDLSPALLRPSRIDMNFIIDVPDAQTRKEYLKAKGIAEELLDEYTEKTEGMSFAQLKEVFVGTKILGKDIDRVVNQLLNPTEIRDYLSEHSSKIGI